MNFLTVSNEQSAFVRLALPVTGVAAARPDGLPYVNYLMNDGIVAVVGNQPLLAANLRPDGTRRLIVYGRLGAGYQLQYSTELRLPGVWQPWLNYTQTNEMLFLDVDATEPIIYYRVFAP